MEEVIGSAVSTENLLDCEWLSNKLDKAVQSASIEDMGGAGGLSGAELIRVNITLKDEPPTSIVVKRTRPGGEASSKQLGLFREAHFFHQLSSIFPKGFLPNVYHVYGNPKTGEKVLVMEDLSNAIQTGYFFGPGSPLNWGKDLTALTARASEVNMTDIVREISVMAAKMHATYWMRSELLDLNWLRGSGWLTGQDRVSWEASQQYVREKWEKQKEKIASSDCETAWNPELVKVIDASYSKISWENFCTRVQKGNWTLTHGDFHPANMMWRPTPMAHCSNHIALLDWEVVGIGSGAQDLGQYFISHCSPESRRDLENASLHLYYSELLLNGVQASKYSWETCFADYVSGGFERWVWLLSAITSMRPPKLVQYFHDQCLVFMLDHDITPENVGQPRC